MKYIDRKGTDHELSMGRKEVFISSFVNEYKECYYLDGEGKRTILYIPGNSITAENEIRRILKNGIDNEKEVDLLLAWKIGGIDHSKSKGKIEFKPDWTNDFIVKERYFICERNNYNAFCNQVCTIQKMVNKRKELKSAEDILSLLQNAIDETSATCFGPVYMLTLLYFLSGGKYPIYDQFAFKAAKSLYFGKRPGQIYVGPAPSKGSNHWIKDTVNLLEEYMWYLDQIFNKHEISREEDQALWVYGHIKEE